MNSLRNTATIKHFDSQIEEKKKYSSTRENHTKSDGNISYTHDNDVQSKINESTYTFNDIDNSNDDNVSYTSNDDHSHNNNNNNNNNNKNNINSGSDSRSNSDCINNNIEYARIHADLVFQKEKRKQENRMVCVSDYCDSETCEKSSEKKKNISMEYRTQESINFMSIVAGLLGSKNDDILITEEICKNTIISDTDDDYDELISKYNLQYHFINSNSEYNNSCTDQNNITKPKNIMITYKHKNPNNIFVSAVSSSIKNIQNILKKYVDVSLCCKTLKRKIYTMEFASNLDYKFLINDDNYSQLFAELIAYQYNAYVVSNRTRKDNFQKTDDEINIKLKQKTIELATSMLKNIKLNMISYMI
ncbi:MAG: hypothetical protein EOP34_04655 [Rickettsiales bacterium]|nr:MAG: hypothetical protein EOP34_04655 [Rickettsiales bacterium]